MTHALCHADGTSQRPQSCQQRPAARPSQEPGATAPVASAPGTGSDGDFPAAREAADIQQLAVLSQALRGVVQMIEEALSTVSPLQSLTLTHWWVLLRLWGHQDLTAQKVLREETVHNAGYLSRLLEELVCLGLIRRWRDTTDRRQVLLGLSEQGRRAVQALLQSAASSQKLHGLVTGQIEQLHSMAQAIIDSDTPPGGNAPQ